MQMGLQHLKDLLIVIIAASLASVTSWAVTGYPTERVTMKPPQEEQHWGSSNGKIHPYSKSQGACQNTQIKKGQLWPKPHLQNLHCAFSFARCSLWFQLNVWHCSKNVSLGHTSKAALHYSCIISGSLESLSHPSKCIVPWVHSPRLAILLIWVRRFLYYLFYFQSPSAK